MSDYYNIIIRDDESVPIHTSRIFECTNPSIKAKFTDSLGQPDFQRLYNLPTIASPEFTISDPKIARIGYLGADGSQQLRTIVGSFSTARLRPVMGDNEWAGHRTHWRVVAGDPYRLIGNLQDASDEVKHPAVLHFPNVCLRSRQIAVMMPFDYTHYPNPESDPVYQAIKKASEAVGYESKRVDEIKGPGRITDDILRLISASPIVVAVLTGANPNVYYEMGLAHARGKIVIPIIEKSEGLPFDISGFRTIFYHNDHHGFEGLSEDVEAILRELGI